MSDVDWHEIEGIELAVDEVTMVVAGGRGICLARTADGLGALDNRCPHQGGPLGEGTIEGEWLICPWHGYEYDPITGAPPGGYDDGATPYPVREDDGIVSVGLTETQRTAGLMGQMVDVMTDWGIDTVFGMVGHSNLGLADALRNAEQDGRLASYGVRHEGAAAFAASAYGKLTGRPAACFTIAGPGATNLLTGLWDANVDRAPVLLNNDELAKISREQVSALHPVWQTALVNPDFAAYAESCGGRGFSVDDPSDLEAALSAALAVDDGPSLVEIRTSPRWT